LPNSDSANAVRHIFFLKVSDLFGKSEFANPIKVSDLFGKSEFANPFGKSEFANPFGKSEFANPLMVDGDIKLPILSMRRFKNRR